MQGDGAFRLFLSKSVIFLFFSFFLHSLCEIHCKSLSNSSTKTFQSFTSHSSNLKHTFHLKTYIFFLSNTMSKYNFILPQHDHPKTVYQKGGIAPPSFNLMNIQNAGKLRLDHFSSSPFSFVHEALSTLQNEHYPIASIPSKFIFT